MSLTLRRPPTLAADLALAGAAALFGSTFLVMQNAVETVEPVPFIVARFGLGALLLLPLARRRGRPTPGLFGAGAAAGTALAIGYVFQTVGLQYVSSSVSAFLTYLLVVLVPLISAVVLRRVPSRSTALGIAFAVAGLALLTGGGSSAGLGRGELFTLCCALAFAVHILVLARVAPRHDVVQLNLVQFSVLVVLLAGPGLLDGGYRFSGSVWLAVFWTGAVTSALAFGLQVWGQRRMSASRAALVLMLEPVFAAVLGYVDGDRLGVAGLVGAVLILVGIVVSELRGAGGPLGGGEAPTASVHDA